jgi:hypothetical protein
MVSRPKRATFFGKIIMLLMITVALIGVLVPEIEGRLSEPVWVLSSTDQSGR